MTRSGPCSDHCGSRVRVGVKVNVGRGVSEGTSVAVFVGKNIGVIVAAWVEDGSGLDVLVAAAGGERRVNPPHPRRKNVNPTIQTKRFCKC
jgi:hypothetical protein